ncbi:dihydroxyacetone kinase phosphoryl donor subunit DhaM [Mangrovibacter yixingensis]|uniref:dihydroxyacetone kinase phosphoryl donor subunit DhaM n=1 Tax=Mangrovibacter yixingensis TaxID=1529639 RepID=UPI001CFB6C3C|nr:dihydroxyacetone kinase phosphoryl donor subunit DhaM [Mangrovibacter yixingensis]
MVNLVIVSHSAALGEGVCTLSQQMLQGKTNCRIAVAAGLDDPDFPIGTDPVKVMDAITSVADAEHILVLMDMGSALLSAETALELLDPEVAAKVTLCAAPLVEGALAAASIAATGASIDRVKAEAENALQAKRVQLGVEDSAPLPPPVTLAQAPGESAMTASWVVTNPHGLHVRPAAHLVAALSGFNAALSLEKEGKCISPITLNQIALLQVRCGDTLRLIAQGQDAAAAIEAFLALAHNQFGEGEATNSTANELPAKITGAVHWLAQENTPFLPDSLARSTAKFPALEQAINHTLDDLLALAHLAEHDGLADISAIFSGQHTLLDDPDLLTETRAHMQQHQHSAALAWFQVLSGVAESYRELGDAYLQARYIDIEDILHRTLCHLLGIPLAIPAYPAGSVLCAENLWPSLAMQLPANEVRAICLRAGSPQSHSAIIAHQRGIVMLTGLGSSLDNWQEGEPITVFSSGKIARPGEEN